MRALVVTRPQGQADTLLQQLKGSGNPLLHIPLLAIHAIQTPVPSILADWVFISPNAVVHTRQNASTTEWQTIVSRTIYAIGAATEAQLRQYGAKSVLTPDISHSEGLLELDSLQAPLNRRMLIACGVGGRDLLETELIARGAQVERYECYQRQTYDPRTFKQLLAKINPPGDALWILSSEQAMTFLASQIEQPVSSLVTSKRLYDIATELTNISVVTTSQSALSSDIAQCVKQLNNKAIK